MHPDRGSHREASRAPDQSRDRPLRVSSMQASPNVDSDRGKNTRAAHCGNSYFCPDDHDQWFTA